MSPSAELERSERAPGLLLGAAVELPDDVEIGGNVVVHAGTRIGAGARLQDGCVVGKPVALGSRSSAAGAAEPGPASIGPGTTVGAGNVDFGLAGTILLGSVPGVWLGSHWSVRVDPAVLRVTLAVVLIGAGLALLIKAGLDIPIGVIVPFPLAVIGLLVVTMYRSRKTRAEVGT
jgi:hypothetical protein